jgi:hypothetical protein
MMGFKVLSMVRKMNDTECLGVGEFSRTIVFRLVFLGIVVPCGEKLFWK